MFTTKTNIQSSFVRKIVSAGLTVAMISGFAFTAFTGLNNSNTPKVHAIGCSQSNTAEDNFDAPSQPNTYNGSNPTTSFNVLGSSFNGWSMINGGSFNVIKVVNGSPYPEGPITAQSGDQYIDVYSANDYLLKPFTVTSTGVISASAYFANFYNSYPNYVPWIGAIQILDSSNNVIASGNQIPFTATTDKNTWFKSEISNFVISTPGSYKIRMFVGDFGVVDTASYCFIDAPTLGSTTATTVAPITGTVGVTAFPTINMTGSNLPDNTVATFTPAGTTTVINGKIIGGNFVPNPPITGQPAQVVPALATQGPATGVLSTLGATSVNVPTNFTPVPVVIPTAGCTQTNTADDNFDLPQQPYLKGGANGTPNNIITANTYNGWTMQNGASFNIVKVDGTAYPLGPINAQSGNQYIDVAGASDYPIKPFIVTSNGLISASAYFASRTNYDPINIYPYVNWTGKIEILDSTLNVIATGNQIPFTSSTDKDTWFQSSVSDVVLPTAGTYYIRMFVGDYGHFDTASYCFINAPTLGSTTATTVAPITGTVGVTTFPTINMTGSNIPDNTLATFTPAGTTTVINGKIIGGNFVPDAGQVVPANATQGPATGVLSTLGATSVNVPTNFTPVPLPTAANDNYIANGTTPITITPLMGDTGTAIKIKSINGTALTLGTAQTIVTPSGTFAITAAGVITYIANLSYTGTATIPYIIEDVAGQTATANLIIAPSAAPTATNDNYNTVGTAPVTLLPLTGDTAGSVINSINGTTLTPGTAQVIPVTGGNVNVSATGAIQFVANSGYTGNATFPYVIKAPNGVAATANQTIAVSAPIVSSSSATVSSSSLIASSSSLVASSSSLLASSSSLVASSSTISSSSMAMSSSSMTMSSAVVENDGVSTSTENSAPNNGDANGDGIKDALQGNVASLPDTGVSPKYVVVAADPTSPCQSLTNVATNTEAANIILDGNYDYPVGFVNFQSPCATSIKVKIYWYGLDVTKTYINRKFNATTNTYADVPGITSSIETVNGVQVLAYTYTVTDNGDLDSDLTFGNIKDPIGPVLVPTATNGGVITIGTQSTSAKSSSIVSSSSKAAGVDSQVVQNSSTLSSIVSTVDAQAESKIINTIRTGGESSSLIVVILSILCLGLVSSISKKEKRNNSV